MPVEPTITVMPEPGDDAEVLASHSRPRISRGRRIVLAAGLAVVLMVAGAGAYLASIPDLALPPLSSSTVLLSRDGRALVSLGSVDRTVLAFEQISPTVRDIAVAAVDPRFWDDDGGPIGDAVAELAGQAIATHGAAAGLRRRMQWAKAARHLSKQELLAYFLNASSFVDGTVGIEAAARARFARSANVKAPQADQLSTAEAIALFAGADPASDEHNRERWREIRDGLVTMGRLAAQQAQALAYPEPATRAASVQPSRLGLLANHVLDELTHAPESPFNGMRWQSLRDAGLLITTTIDIDVQVELESALGNRLGSVLEGQPDTFRAAGVIVEPGTGRVLAYDGGPGPLTVDPKTGRVIDTGATDGRYADFAGTYVDEGGARVGLAHTPGGSFMAYTLAAALRAGWSLKSQWRWQPHAQPGRPGAQPIVNAGMCPDNMKGQTCSLLSSVRASLNVPLYDVTSSLGAPAVLNVASDAGIKTVWTDTGEPLDLSGLVTYPAGIGMEVGIGQYRVTVLDQANAMATFAAPGTRAEAHFVRSVEKDGVLVWSEALPNPAFALLLQPGQWADFTYALSGGGDLAIKTGTVLGSGYEPTEVWSIGYNRALAAAIWMGTETGVQPLRDDSGADVYGDGLPTTALRQVLTNATAVLGLTPEPFPAPTFGGDLHPPGSA